MTTVITDNRVRNRENYLTFAKAFAKDTLEEKGCISMEVHIDPEQEDRVVFISCWEKKEDFLHSVGGPAFNKHIPNMAPYYISGTDTFLEKM